MSESSEGSTYRSKMKAVLGFILGFVVPTTVFLALLEPHMNEIALMIDSMPLWLHGVSSVVLIATIVWVIGYGVSGGLPR